MCTIKHACSVVSMQPNQDGSELHCKLIRQRAPLSKSQTVTILTQKNCSVPLVDLFALRVLK